MKLHQALLTGISVLFVIKVLIVVHVPAHLLLVIHRALRGQVRSIYLIYGSEHYNTIKFSSTYFSENRIDVLPQWMVILDGFTDFSHLLQQTRLHSENTEAKLQTSQ